MELQVAQAMAEMAGMTVKDLPIGFAFMREERAVMHVFVVVSPKNARPMLPLDIVIRLRNSALAGMEVRAVFAMPKGVFVKKITEGPIDGWTGVENNQLAVWFGKQHSGGKVFNEEAEPLKQLPLKTIPEWFQ